MTAVTFVKYRLRWRFTDSGKEEESTFWVPDWENPKETMKAVLNIVELSASEYGFGYKLEEIDYRVCRMVG